jgi:hypothetical protein
MMEEANRSKEIMGRVPREAADRKMSRPQPVVSSVGTPLAM